VRFYNFQRERRGEAAISEDFSRLCEHLSEIYPNVAFTLADHRITARIINGARGSLVELFSFVSSRIPYLTTTITIDYESLQVVFRADGIGIIKEDSWYEFFEHDLDPKYVKREYKGDEDAINDFLQDHFHEQIGPQMEDPFFNPSGEGCELFFERGSQDELERLMKLFIMTEPGIETREDDEVRLYAATDETDPYLESNDCYHSERLDELTQIALSENRPVGWSFEYNDGASNRRSGYDEQAECLTWDIGEIMEDTSAREKMAARRELRKWLEAHGLDPERFDTMTGGKRTK
jgi:hypothetical protein